MVPNLKPCPLCGGTAAIVRYSNREHEFHAVIKCTNCGLTLDHRQEFAVAPRRPFAPSDDGERVRVALDISPFEAWNRRVGVE